jgi:hypothetical protein
MALAAPYSALRSFLEEQYGVSDRAFYAVTIFIAHSVTCLLFNGGVALFDSFGWLKKYEIYRKPAEVPEPALFKTLYTEAALNHFVTTPLSSFGFYFIARYLLFPLGIVLSPRLHVVVTIS